TRLRHELPALQRMIHAPGMHQLVDQHVVANRWWHRHEPPVHTDVPAARTRSPAPALIPDADAGHGQAVRGSELEQPRRKLAPGLRHLREKFRRTQRRRRRRLTIEACLLDASPLLLDPRALVLG